MWCILQHYVYALVKIYKISCVIRSLMKCVMNFKAVVFRVVRSTHQILTKPRVSVNDKQGLLMYAIWISERVDLNRMRYENYLITCEQNNTRPKPRWFHYRPWQRPLTLWASTQENQPSVNSRAAGRCRCTGDGGNMIIRICGLHCET